MECIVFTELERNIGFQTVRNKIIELWERLKGNPRR